MADRERSPGLDDTVALSAPGSLAPGHVFAERYRIEEHLGAGAMGVVYRVHDLRLDEPVALKVMAFAAGEAARRFVEEVRLARRVTHPHVARTHDIGEHAGLVYCTMELVPGETLEARIDRAGALDPAVAAGFAVQLASALEAAHAAGVIHRDLKPSNVIVTHEGRAVVTDFGIARAAHQDAKRTAGIIGTPAYMSPEQAAGTAIDARSDIYALGIILYELLTARLPFEEEEPMAAALARLRRAPTHLSEHQPVPQPLSELTMWMLARDRDARPSSARVVRESLEAFLLGASSTAIGKSATAVVSPGTRALAVLPFRYRGDAEHDYLGEGLAEELIDTLSRTRGIKVLALGATARFAADRDPMRVGAELSADAVVDGSVQFAAGRLRVTARLHDAHQGVQLWTDRFDVAVEDLFALQESLGKRLAEALRLELHAHLGERSLPSEAVALYMRARRLLRLGFMGGSKEMLETLDRCLALAPDFAPAYAAHAMAAVRGWWLESTSEGGARRERAEQSLARAIERASDEPETQLARASFALQLGDYPTSARALARALEIAPTMAEAHQLLGYLESEAGRLRQGYARLELSLELDPGLNASRMALARLAAYQGRFDEAQRFADAFLEAVGEHHPGGQTTRVRLAMLRRDLATIAQIIESIERTETALADMAPFFRLLLGETDVRDAEAIRLRTESRFGNLRFRMVVNQVCTEVFASTGHHQEALRVLAELADGILVDIVWLDRCAVLEPLRDYPAYAEAAAKVRHRAAAVWLP